MRSVPKFIFGILLATLVLLAGAYFFPWSRVNWGKIQFLPGKTITVTGEAQTQAKNQIATFTAGVQTTNDNKDQAVKEVNEKMQKIIDDLKNFGIKEEDIKTSNSSIYQQQESYYDESGRQKTRPGQWIVNNQVEVVLRDVNRASALTDLLSKSGANNVYGPNFSLEDTKTNEAALLEKAIEDARRKADTIAKSSGVKMKRVISITEGEQPGRILPMGLGAGGGGAPIEPGTSSVSKTVTVIFEIE